MSSAPTKAREIFTVAVEQYTPDQWSSYLDEACGDDLELRHRVDLLLEAHVGDESILDSPAVACPTIDQPITEKPGTQIGPYKLLQQIGEGGMGVVYMAEQKEPVKRRVALKIIKPGMDTLQVIARFEAERQALAMMDHPNIAKVLDAGATESGRPYFVMELVNGISITQYCDEQHLTPKERLDLFVPICQAVQHAHQKGIIHRDLKPSNILVALYDGRAVPKIIDFGVAKATSQSLTEKTMFTQLGQVIGTLEYMSPEQAQRNQLDIDTRSDIYSLGVVLYELLTGETPFDRARLRSAAFDEMLRIIREEEPSKPSTKVSSSQSLPSIAANRRTEAARLGSTIRGELDWIVMKALDKDRARRYDTASKFAEDVQHYLNDETVVACPPSRAYQFRKFIRRNRVAIVTALAISLALIAGTIGTTWQAVVATEQRNRAVAAERLAENRHQNEQRQRKRAEQAERVARQEASRAASEAAVAVAVKDFLDQEFLALASPEFEPDRDITLRAAVDRAAKRIEIRFDGTPNAEAGVRETIGTTYLSLGMFDQAEEHLTRAIELLRNSPALSHTQAIRAANNLANLYAWQGRSVECQALAESTLKKCQEELGEDHRETAKSLNLIGIALRQQGKTKEGALEDAEQYHRRALEISEAVNGPDDPDTLFIMGRLAHCIKYQGRTTEFESMMREHHKRCVGVLGAEHPTTIRSAIQFAEAKRLAGKLADSEKLHRDTVSIAERSLGPSHPSTLLASQYLGRVIGAQGRYEEAVTLLRATLDKYNREPNAKRGHARMCQASLMEVLQAQEHEGHPLDTAIVK